MSRRELPSQRAAYPARLTMQVFVYTVNALTNAKTMVDGYEQDDDVLGEWPECQPIDGECREGVRSSGTVGPRKTQADDLVLQTDT